jgi:pyrophosphate--fructose-6-phosphate 1-phosphotransferase
MCMEIQKGELNMKISSLQKARYEYSPKLPGMLRNGISNICVKEGEETQSVADQEKIKALFPNTYGKKEITFQQGENTSETKKQVVGVIPVDRLQGDTMLFAGFMMH